MKRNICRCDENRMAYDPDVDNYWCEDHGHWLCDKPDVIVMLDGERIPNYDKQARRIGMSKKGEYYFDHGDEDQNFCSDCGRAFVTEKDENVEFDTETGVPILVLHRKRCPKYKWGYSMQRHDCVEIYEEKHVQN